MSEELGKPFKDKEDALDFTQSIRKRLADQICSGGQMPVDKDSRNALLATLSDIDKQVLGVARLQQDDKNSANDRAIAERIALINRGVQHNPNEIRGDITGLPARQVISDDALGDIPTVDGEMVTGLAPENMQEFLTRIEP